MLKGLCVLAVLAVVVAAGSSVGGNPDQVRLHHQHPEFRFV